ncbi:MAPEG family protein [uncultured Tateyamaria sp.]|uniref:MAPEG family protein n=1 Tax=uncultured Tateyamaria sp. TaxID=455651 RepID=UPI003456C6DC
MVQQVLMITVGAHRGGVKVGAGSGGATSLERKIRCHGNLAENAPIFLLALAFLELSDASVTVWAQLLLPLSQRVCSMFSRSHPKLALTSPKAVSSFRPCGLSGRSRLRSLALAQEFTCLCGSTPSSEEHDVTGTTPDCRYALADC